jgi:hypothetical protein
MEETAGALADAAPRTAGDIEALTGEIGGCSCAAIAKKPLTEVDTRHLRGQAHRLLRKKSLKALC